MILRQLGHRHLAEEGEVLGLSPCDYFDNYDKRKSMMKGRTRQGAATYFTDV